MALTAQQMIDECNKHYPTGAVLDAAWVLHLNFAQLTAGRDYIWSDLKVTSDYNIVADDEVITIASNLRYLYSAHTIQTTPYSKRRLIWTPDEEFLGAFDRGTEETDRPKFYWLWGRSNLYLGPASDDSYTLRTREARWAADFTTGDLSATCDIKFMDDFLIHHAVAQIYMLKGQDDGSLNYYKMAGVFLARARAADANLHAEMHTKGTDAYEL